MKSSLKSYWKNERITHTLDDLLLYNSRIIVPSSLRRESMLKIHEGNQGVKGVNRDSGHLCGGQELQVKFSSLSKTADNVQRKLAN